MKLRLNYSQRILFFLISSSLVTLMSTLGFMAYFTYYDSKSALVDKGESITQLVANYAITPLMNNDPKSALATFQSFTTLPEIHQIAIYGADDKLFTLYQAIPHTKPKLIKEDKLLFEDDEFYIYKPIYLNERYLGTVFLETDLDEFKKKFWLKNSYIILIFLLLLLLSYFFSKKLQKSLANPVLSLTQVSKQIKNSKDYSVRVTCDDDTEEIKELYSAFNEMLLAIGSREKAREAAQAQANENQESLELLAQELELRVSQRTVELHESLIKLEKAQDKLVESEKMAALGNLVSGVAHEVNTPLGNAVTATSIVAQTSKKIADDINSNHLKKSDLLANIEILTESSQIIQENIRRASELITSFKKISIDQQYNDQRAFCLVDYSREIFHTFAAVLAKGNISWFIQAVKEIEILSYPGVYAQILTNLIQNSLVHGFEDRDKGLITLEISKGTKYITLHYSDDGKGIEESIKKRIFEPFVTTKRNQGGTGLGMNIIYNLVTQKLHGTISFESKKDEGCHFTIKFPIVLDDTMS